MKRWLTAAAGLFLATSFVVGLALADVQVKRLDGGGGSGGDGGGAIQGGTGGGGAGAVRVAPMSRGSGNEFFRGERGHEGVVRMRPNRARGGILGLRAAIAGPGRTRIVRQSAVPTPKVAAITGNTRVVRNIQTQGRVEVVPNHAYWHTIGGTRYVHYLRGGINWYGFYYGPHFYWTRFYDSHWWWYDPFFAHWVFWYGGYWWYHGPGGVLYVDVNDTYYPYDDAPVEVTPPPASSPASMDTENNGGEFTSRDGTRMVQIHGPQSEAFLYDKTGSEPQYLAYLGKNVDRVRFSGGVDGKPLHILVDFKNGDFTLFNAEGEQIDLTPPETPSETPSAPSEPPSAPPDIPQP